MRKLVTSVIVGLALAACSGGGGGDLPKGVRGKSASDVGKMCIDFNAAWLKGGSGNPERAALMKMIDKTCCPQVADAAKKLGPDGRALVWYAFARQMDNVYSPDEVQAFDDGFNTLRNAMAPDAFDAAYNVVDLRFSCGTDLERKAGMSPY